MPKTHAPHPLRIAHKLRILFQFPHDGFLDTWLRLR